MSTKRSEGMIRRTKKTNDSKKKFVVEQLLLLHNWVVASIGDLKLLALFGVLVLKSFFLPMNITLSLLKLGFITPSWPEPSLSDDLEKVEIRNIFLCHDDLEELDLTGSTWKEMYICGWCSSSYPSNNRHTVS